MVRKHVATGKKPPGGKRPGAGRKEGTTNALALGEVRAVKAAGLRVPESATQEQRELADECLGKLAEIMRGGVYWQNAPHSLKAATVIREEICGPVKQRVEHSFAEMTDEQLEAKSQALLKAAREKEQAATEPKLCEAIPEAKP